jgi:hypothetical protein
MIDLQTLKRKPNLSLVRFYLWCFYFTLGHQPTSKRTPSSRRV